MKRLVTSISVLITLLGITAGCAGALKVKAALVAGQETAVNELADAQTLEITLYHSNTVPALTQAKHVEIQTSFKDAAQKLQVAGADIKAWDGTGIPPATLAAAKAVILGIKNTVDILQPGTSLASKLQQVLDKLKGGEPNFAIAH
jgi:hypothetical protein